MRQGSRESASLLNPAFLALLTYRSVEAYVAESRSAMPFFLPYLCVPASLHPDVRDELTYNKSTNLAAWVQDAPGMRIAIRQAAVGLTPYVSEAISFALVHDVLKVSEGSLLPGKFGPTQQIKFETEEVHDCQRAAKYMGRWLANSGPVSHIAAVLGVKP